MDGNETNHNNNINKYELLKFINKDIGSLIEEVEPTFKLINNFSEINILLNKNPDKFKLIYFHKKKIKNILYECEEEIILDSDKKENTLDKIFYLSLLVTENKEIVNYNYSIDFIKQLNKTNENNDLKLSEIIFSKIILDLIEYFTGFEDNNGGMESSINAIKFKNIDIINKNNNILKEFGLDDKDFIKKSIDEIYCDIIKILLHGTKDYKNIYNIINQLNLEKIDITNFIFKEISKILSNDKNIIDKKIININDLFNVDKIEFYYILLKYILKNLCYIYQIPFLVETRAFILKNIKFIKIDNNNKDKEKLEYLIDKLIGSKYYSENFRILQNDHINDGKSQNNKNDKLKEDQKMDENCQKVSNYSNGNHLIYEIETQQENQNLSTRYDTSNKSKEEGINQNEKFKKLPTIEKISLILEGIIIHYQNNKNHTKINKFICLNAKENDKIIIKYDELIELKKVINFFELDMEQFIKYASFFKLVNFIQKFDFSISEENKDKKFRKISLKLEHEKLYEKQNKNEIYNITCEYFMTSQNCLLELNYKDENILLNGFNQGFLALLCELNTLL